MRSKLKDKKAPLNWVAHGADEGWFGNLPSSLAYYNPNLKSIQFINNCNQWSFQIYQDPADMLRVMIICERHNWWHLRWLAGMVYDRLIAKESQR